MRFAFVLLLLINFGTAFAQRIDSLLQLQRAKNPHEKVHIHFDKDYYNPGETIWYKAYVFAGAFPSEVSKNFYAELLDADGNVLSRNTAPIIFSGASGSFDLDTNLAKPVVYVKAYTVSMLNSDTDFIYTRPIRILTTKATAAKATATVSESKISFLPEGGNYVAGIPCTVAFIATDQQGLPVKITGTITNSKGAKVGDIKSEHNGMGRFILTPEAGVTYSASWKDERGKTYTTPLPPVQTEGVVLTVTEEGPNRRFSIFKAGQVAAQEQLQVVAYANQEVLFSANVNMAGRNSATGIFPTEAIPSGILKITVFDANYKPICERITFVNNREFEFDGDVFMTQRELTPRGLNKVEVMISDTMAANLSLSIVDADVNERNRLTDNIVTRLLLTGELRGKIVNPYGYFYGITDSTSYYLDLVMLTHGWRRYNWDDVLAGKTPTPKWKENDYLSLDGKVVGLPTGSISSDLQLTSILQTADSAQNIFVLPVDRKGAVFTEGLIFYDRAKLYFNPNDKRYSIDNTMLLLENGLYPGYKKTKLDTSRLNWMLPPVSTPIIANNSNLTKLAIKATQERLKMVTLENVTVTARGKTAKEKMEEKYVSSLFSGDGTSFDLVNDPLAMGQANIFQYLQGKVAGLQINTSGGTPTLSWRGSTPAIFLNEMRSDADMISSIPISNIAYVKVLRPGQGLAFGGGNGTIAIYTRKGGDVQETSNTKGMSSIQVLGYSAIKEFYSPDYATIAPDKADIPDYRTTLYWNPNIYLDKTRKRIRLQFYNNDVTKRFRLVMEGINAEGKLIHVVKEVPTTF